MICCRCKRLINKKVMTINQAAEKIGVSTKTIQRWEKGKLIPKAKRDWRGWRMYTMSDVKRMKKIQRFG